MYFSAVSQSWIHLAEASIEHKTKPIEFFFFFQIMSESHNAWLPKEDFERLAAETTDVEMKLMIEKLIEEGEITIGKSKLVGLDTRRKEHMNIVKIMYKL